MESLYGTFRMVMGGLVSAARVRVRGLALRSPHAAANQCRSCTFD